MLHDAALVFDYPDADTASLVYRAVSQEAGEISGDRTTAAVSLDGPSLHVDIDADDLVALRAGINTWTTLVEVAEETAALGRF
ncbi:KEOPS complex subunit Pcc1 [Natronomonas sp. EA1]|uniref:KEOPS complex subunit Pcc1 n=1 Tax=Natronomonas sp. EA1 TaxID=3421655 RepID=UPI003EBA4804